ncbi:OLC1v1005891C1 [Oldenlandia corymbosa var. corymbosa]|uniref:OLC1v1005891C1 n=1 Tax=Oldenlandia corymbosa var. corymbosa TaxID=529605 RepID=A0AAV1DFL9_OLDCO|nr:OLC1v1005891C1 [Oldenlandia corymbosa var. corymbosa]
MKTSSRAKKKSSTKLGSMKCKRRPPLILHRDEPRINLILLVLPVLKAKLDSIASEVDKEWDEGKLPMPKVVKRLTTYQIYLKKDGSFPEWEPEFEKGTTVVGLVYEEGIIVAADRSGKSLEFPPNFVQLNSHMLATISGGSGSESLLKDLQKKCNIQEQMKGRKPSVAEVLHWLAEALSAYKEEVGILIAVWSESEHGLYRMNGNGELVEGNVLATGSGSSGALYEVRCCERFVPVTRAANVGRVSLRSEYAP